MRWARFLFVVLLAWAIPAHAWDLLPGVSIATEDPFAVPGQAPKADDIFLFGGGLTSVGMASSFDPFHTDFEGNYIAGGEFTHDFADLGGGFVLGAQVGTAVRFGDDDPSEEFWSGFRLRQQGLVIGNLVISPGFAAGFSVVTSPIGIEREREIEHDGNATFLFHLAPEIAFRWRDWPNWDFVYEVHHRSGGKGLLGHMGEGENADVVGARYHF